MYILLYFNITIFILSKPFFYSLTNIELNIIHYTILYGKQSYMFVAYDFCPLFKKLNRFIKFFSYIHVPSNVIKKMQK